MGHLVRAAADDVEVALGLVAAAGVVPWRSPAAPHYRAAVDDVHCRLLTTRSAVEAALPAAAALDAAAGRTWLVPVVRNVLGGLVP